MKLQDKINLFLKKEGFYPEAHEICPKFYSCSVNKCPLYFNFSKLKLAPEDKGKKCKCPKKIRIEIGKYFKLKNMGLTLKELSSMRQSIQMKKDFLLTQREILETPQNVNEEGENENN